MPVSHRLAPNPAHLHRRKLSLRSRTVWKLGFGKPVWVATLFTEMVMNPSTVTAKLKKHDLRNAAAGSVCVRG